MAQPGPERVLLEAVRLLHERGFEGVRFYGRLHGTGHWRCTLGVVGQPLQTGTQLLRYTSASHWRFWREDADEPCTAEQLAHRLQALPGFEVTRFACPTYRVWFRVLLQHIGPDAVPYHGDSDGYFDAVSEGCVRFISRAGQSGDFPLPPVL